MEDAKLKTVFNIVGLGHDAFKETLDATVVHILNNTRSLIKYDRSTLIDMSNLRILGVCNQHSTSQSSEYAMNIKKVAKLFINNKSIKYVTPEEIAKLNADSSTLKALKYFEDQKDNILLIPLIKPHEDKQYLWVVEFFQPMDKNSIHVLSLLSKHYSEALWYHDKPTNIIKNIIKNKKYFSPFKVLGYLTILFIIVCFFKISQNVSSTFELIPEEKLIEYAPYDGRIERVNFKDGDSVKTGDSILQYDIKGMMFDMNSARNKYNEITAELSWVKQKSFSEHTELGKIKILDLKKNNEQIAIDKLQWFLSKSDMLAKMDGVLVLNDIDELEGKMVSEGEPLFEIVTSKNLQAEVYINESDASVLTKNTKITLYLHSRPETPIRGKIISISPKPMLTKTNQFCYIVKVGINTQGRVGMRGVARVSGNNVFIGYYLFKNLVLWWRKL